MPVTDLKIYFVNIIKSFTFYSIYFINVIVCNKIVSKQSQIMTEFTYKSTKVQKYIVLQKCTPHKTIFNQEDSLRVERVGVNLLYKTKTVLINFFSF